MKIHVEPDFYPEQISVSASSDLGGSISVNNFVGGDSFVGEDFSSFVI